MPSFFRRGPVAAALSLCLALAACGGGGSSGQFSGSTINGTVLMDANAPVGGNANVCLFGVAGGQGNPVNLTVAPPVDTGTLLTPLCISTNAQGQFSQALPNFYGPVLVQITGGVYNGFADGGATTTLTALSTPSTTAAGGFATTNAALQALVMVGGGGTVNVLVTPLTTIATAITTNMPGGLTMANYATAVAQVNNEFQLGNLSILNAPTTGDAQDLALRGVEEYLLLYGSSTGSDPTGYNLINWTTGVLGSVSTLYTTAYNTINGTSASFNFY